MARFKRSLFGYGRNQVDAAIASAEAQAAAHERDLLLLSEMLVSREREIQTLKEELSEAHARHDRSLRSLETLARQIEDVHAQARGQATRIRMKALNDAVRVSEKAGDAMGAIREIEAVADQLGGGQAATNGNGEAGKPGNPAKPMAADPPPSDSDTGRLGYYQGDVEVEIGPLGDFSQLLGFESAAGRIEGASDISVRRFASGRVTLGMRLDEPIELLRELEERAPFEFKVRQTGGRRLVLDIDDDQASDESE